MSELEAHLAVDGAIRLAMARGIRGDLRFLAPLIDVQPHIAEAERMGVQMDEDKIRIVEAALATFGQVFEHLRESTDESGIETIISLSQIIVQAEELGITADVLLQQSQPTPEERLAELGRQVRAYTDVERDDGVVNVED